MPSRAQFSFFGRCSPRHQPVRLAFLFWLLLAMALGLQNAWSQTNRSRAQLPPTPPAPTTTSRVNIFRQLLGMTPSERESELAKRTAPDRQVLEEKIREFEALTPEQREARLQALQRQLDFRLFIRLPASNRVELLGQLAEGDRKWQTERLAQWDQVPADLQSAILTNLPLLRFLFPDSTGLSGRPGLDSRSLTASQRDAMEKAVAEWNQLPEEKRQAISNHFCRIFLDEKKKAEALQPLSLAERSQMERCLQVFNRLPRGQQAVCMSGFHKFAQLTPEERQEFLRNAEQWQQMSSQDRQVWRQLVNRLRPPLPPSPPGMRLFSPMPPIPPSPSTDFRAKPRAVPLAGTNR